MKRRLKVIAALFKKDCKDTLQNMNVMILVILPLVFGVLYTNIFSGMMEDMPTSFVLNMVTGMTLALIPTSFLATLVAEEKEKHTLRTLMLSGVTAAEFIASKILLTLMLLELLSIACFFITGSPVNLLLVYLLLVTIGSLGLLLIGAIIGLVCKDQMSTGVLSAPISLILLLPPMLGSMSPFLAAIAQFTPIEWVMRLFNSLQEGGSLFSPLGVQGFLVLLAWVVLPALAFGLVYRRKRLDN